MESRLTNKEEELCKMTEFLEKRNQKLQKAKQWLREKHSEVDVWEQEGLKEEDTVKQMRLHIVRRKETLGKKEINVLEWQKRN